VTTLAREFKASFAFVERNFYLSRRYWGWEIAFLIYSAAGALSVSLIGADQGSPSLILTLIIGAVFWNYLSVIFSWIAETIAIERWEGTLEYTMMAPVRRVIHTVAILVVMVLFFPQLDLTGANFLSAAVVMAIGSFSFVGIGMMAAVLPLLYVERGAQMTFVIQSVLLLVSGVYYSIDVLPAWMQVLSYLSPATYVLHGVRGALIEGHTLGALGGDIAPLIVMGIVFIPVGLWAFGRAERYAKRTGKLKRVG
jgi:ABC-2 type transport system permease protein